MANKLSATAKGDCHFTAVRLIDVDRLEKDFAKLTPEGWEIPDWLRALRKQAQFNSIQDRTAWTWKD